MRVLYVVGSCLWKNTSANMSHNGYVQGLLENGCKVDVLMAEDSWGAQDNALPMWDNVTYYQYPSVSFQDKMRKRMRKAVPVSPMINDNAFVDSEKDRLNKRMLTKNKVRQLAKTIFYKCFPLDPCYPLEMTWLKNSSKFNSDIQYDLVISNSSPAASHKLVSNLLKINHLKCNRWIQIWEDPWYFDLYGNHSEFIREEEHTLLQVASEIIYVSPLTLKYQQQYYSDCAHKMKHIPLPYLDFARTKDVTTEGNSFGYFGDYYSQTRNIVPFYEALNRSGNTGYIYGDSNILLQSTDKIEISGRVTLDVLDRVQSKTNILVHLCNLHGGQIPGKIYHYSATEKPILFILDGTAEEQTTLKTYFSKFERYYFCENNTESILATMNIICSNSTQWKRVDAFSPKSVVQQIL